MAARRTHSLVRERKTAKGTSYAVVYPGLAAGRYVIWRHMDTPVGEVTIDGGRVTRFRWPDRAGRPWARLLANTRCRGRLVPVSIASASHFHVAWRS
jgi:hypothetical protein